MLIQCLVLIATMLVLAGAILTSTLVSAKAILHQTMLTKTQTAMSDATQAFVASTASFVKTYGTEWAPQPAGKPTTETLCTSPGVCPYLATMNWVVTGTSAKVAANGANAQASSAANASYLANTVDEQRISATISVQISNSTGTVVYSERSREVTARIFGAAPYVVVTGTRDISAADGSYRGAEGDTAGALQVSGENGHSNGPVAAFPDHFTDTRILTTIDCNNSIPGMTAANGNAYIDRQFHPYGNVAWREESPCSSGNYATDGMPAGYTAPSGSLFAASPADPNSAWNKGDEDLAPFPR